MIIISIDPGYERLGVAVLNKENSKESLLFSDCIITSKEESFEKRLLQIANSVEKIIEEYKPETLAIEKLYFTTNQKTASNVSEVRGALIYLASKKGLRVRQFTPLEIKVAVTGDGKADKKQVIQMIPKLLKISKSIKYDDEYDAIAVGLTCFAIPEKLQG